MTSTRPSQHGTCSMGAVVSVEEMRAAVRTVRSLFTEAGRAQMEMVVLTSEPVQRAHTTIRDGENVMLVVLPVRVSPWLRVWSWHVAYRVADSSTSYEWGLQPTLGLAMRAGHRFAGRKAAMLRHPSSRHAEE